MDYRVSYFLLHVLIVATSSLLESSKACEENAVQLAGGRNKFEGRVEVCQDGQWKTVCNDRWDDREARVVCRQLGFAEDSRTDRVIYARLWFDNAATDQAIISRRWNCAGSERDLISCPTNSLNYECIHWNDAGVYCYGRSPYDRCQDGELRLVDGGSDGLGGRVEICLGDFWGTVCDDEWDVRDATAVCRQLGLSEIGIPTRSAFFGQGQGPVHLSRAECKEGDTLLTSCTIDMSGVSGCDHSRDAGVICNGTSSCTDNAVRLVGGESEQEGTVEICYNGVWGMLYYNCWDEIDATVVCTQLGYGQPGMPMSSFRAAGMGLILFDNVTCDKSHTELFQCVHLLDIGTYNSDHEDVAGVICPNLTSATTNIPPSTLLTLSTNINSVGIATSIVSNATLRSSELSAATLGGIGVALAVAFIAIVCMVLIAVVVTKKSRKSQYTHHDATRKGAIDNPVYDGSISVSPLDANNRLNLIKVEKEFENPLYSESGQCYVNTLNTQPESEYEGLHSDCSIKTEALYENTQNGIVQGTLTTTNNGTVCVTASEAVYDAVLPASNCVGRESCYSALGLTDLNQPRLQNRAVLEDEYSRLQHN